MPRCKIRKPTSLLELQPLAHLWRTMAKIGTASMRSKAPSIEAVVQEIGVSGLKTRVENFLDRAVEYAFLRLFRGAFGRRYVSLIGLRMRAIWYA